MLADLSAVHAEALARLPRLAAALRSFPWPLGVLLIVAGAFLLLFGARPRRPVALAGGSIAGGLAGLALSGVASQALQLSASSAAAIGAALVGLLAILVPPVFPLALGAVAGGALGAHLPSVTPLVGAPAGALALGGVGLLLARPLAAGLAGLVGAGLCVAGLAALAPALPTADLARHPLVALGLVVVLAVCGAAAQLDTAWGGRAGGKASRRGQLEPPPVEAND